MNSSNNFDPDYLRAMTAMLYRALLFLISLSLALVMGALVWGLWGDQLAAWWRSPPAVADAPAAAPSRVEPAAAAEEIVDGIHVPTGLVVAEGFEAVRITCTACHSGKLVAQNRATREGWQEMIRWMQRTQGLWDLGEQEAVILDYLAANYAPEESGRRLNLDLEEIEWYRLEE